MTSFIKYAAFGALLTIGLSGHAAENRLKLKGLKKIGDPKVFDARNLADEINGAAELYFDYGFQQLVLHHFESKRVQIAVSVYDQGTPINAFGIFRREQPKTSGIPLNIGAQAYVSPPYSCALQQGAKYVRIDITKGEMTEPRCKKWLKRVAKTLDGSSQLPAQLSHLPQKNILRGTEAYTRKGYLGTGDLAGSLHANYKTQTDKKYQIFVLLDSEGAAIEKTWQKLLKKWQLTKCGEKSCLMRKIPYRDPVVVIKTDKIIVGITDAGKVALAKRLLIEQLALSPSESTVQPK